MRSVWNFLIWISNSSPIADAIRSNFCSILDNLHEWSENKHDNLTLNIKRLRQKLNNLRAQVDWLVHEEAKLECELEMLLSLEEEYWKTRSRADWLLEGDMSTAYFHRKASQRQRLNSIRSIIDSNSTIIIDVAGIEHAILYYFLSIYIYNNSSCKLQDGMIDKVMSEKKYFFYYFIKTDSERIKTHQCSFYAPNLKEHVMQQWGSTDKVRIPKTRPLEPSSGIS
ncbi:hypothetical protein M9H77_35795 [Catharanthus roseus]|uniref:Uncharacterized protein n=1 Tax=Catharanthus roseus TaxID=4058 RepID=A0ACB9ZQA8_CATRO|nr:hypothetical protein M9H77_35795 [Catharanthus roseus]